MLFRSRTSKAVTFEINDNSVAILLTYGTARILLAGDAEANEEEYMADGPYTGPLTIVNISKVHTRRAEVPRRAHCKGR